MNRRNLIAMGCVCYALSSAPTMVAATGTGYLFVSSEKDHTITVLDGKTYDVVKRIAVGERPRHISFSPDRKSIYAACGDGGSIDVIDVATLEVASRYEDIDDPEAFDISPDGRLLYLSLEDDAALGVLDLQTAS